MGAEQIRCADSAEARDESLYGTASFVRRWLLLEQPGSWGPDALLESRLPQRGAVELRRRARAHRIRIVLIRRGARLSSAKRQCYLALTDRTKVRLSRIELDGFEDILDVDLSPLAAGGSIEGARHQTDPLFLVCTHGRHDACCSIRGNQVSRVACADPALDAWECSHIGGDRFAANLVCFPHGIYYGRVRPDEVPALTTSYARGVLNLANYRGRCCYTFPLQAAEYFVRRETGVTAVEDVSLIETSEEMGRLNASFSVGPGRRADVEVRVGELPGAYRLTCGSRAAERIPRYELVSCNVGDARARI